MNRLIVVVVYAIPMLLRGQWEPVDNGVGGGAVVNMLWDSANARLYTFGNFYLAGSQDLLVNGTAYWEDASWHNMGSGVNVQFPGTVHWVYQGVFYDSSLVVVGRFDSIGHNQAAARIARWRNNAWEPLDSLANCTGNTYGLSVIGGKLNLHGSFDSIGGQAIHNWAIWDGVQWAAGDTTGVFNWSTKEAIEYHGQLYVGGNFETQDGRNDLLRKVGDQWEELGMGLQGDCYVSDLEVYDDLLWVTGFFFSDAGNAATGVMAWNGEQWLDPFPQVEMFGWGRSLTLANGKLYFVGPMNVSGFSGEFQIGEYDGNTLCIRGGNQMWTAKVVVTPDTIFANAAEQVACCPPSGMVVNHIMKLPLNYPADTCFTIGVGLPQGQQQVQSQVVVYPNPATSQITITGLSNLHSPVTVELIDALGRKAVSLSTTLGNGTCTFALPQLVPGMYRAVVRGQEGGAPISLPVVIEQ